MGATVPDYWDTLRPEPPSPLLRVALTAVMAWQEPHEAFWWGSLGDALDAAGIDKEQDRAALRARLEHLDGGDGA